jgi:hypothetical protein
MKRVKPLGFRFSVLRLKGFFYRGGSALGALAY